MAPATRAAAGPRGAAARRTTPRRASSAQVLKGTEDAWGQVFARGGRRYQKPTLVLFDGRVESACGMASAAVGPFYCPADRKVYLDPAFFRELDQRFGAPGDFAQAYVIAHEVGHHVQNLLGVSDQVTALQQRARSQEQANELSVRLELQADCFAGVYGALQPAVPRAGRRRGGAARGRGDRRRHDPEAGAGLRRPRVVDARLGRDARALVRRGSRAATPRPATRSRPSSSDAESRL